MLILKLLTQSIRNGQFLAGMFYDLELTTLSDLVNQVNLFDAGYLFLVTADGTTIAHPQSKYNGEKVLDRVEWQAAVGDKTVKYEDYFMKLKAGQ